MLFSRFLFNSRIAQPGNTWLWEVSGSSLTANCVHKYMDIPITAYVEGNAIKPVSYSPQTVKI